tara:strand:+ start:1092 stop:2078 length:987 start_codon:yes stop_codon:yes gene_type:complete
LAVYTSLNNEQLSDFLKLYKIGKLISFTGITEGIENSNFHLKTTSGEFILTIFEKRVNEKDLPFFINVMLHLSKKKFFCPKPIGDAKDNYLQKLLGKPAIIVNYLQGKSKTKITMEDCFKVGSKIALMHIKTKDFSSERENSLSINGWQNLIKECNATIPDEVLNKIEPNILNEIQNAFNYCKKFWPSNLPKGFIHADMFPDNVFFHENEVSGLIDFYFSCTDILAYDLAIAINAWCFDNEFIFNQDRYQHLLDGYNTKRRLSTYEVFYLPLLSKAASIRFLLTRLYDWVHTPKDADVLPKNPKEYINKLKHFRKVVKNINYQENYPS